MSVKVSGKYCFIVLNFIFLIICILVSVIFIIILKIV